MGNIVEIDTVVGAKRKLRKYLLAGNGINRAIWVRDGCMCARALVMAGHVEPLLNLVQLYLESLDAKLTPIEVFDDVSPVWRQAAHVASRYLGAAALGPPSSPRPYSSCTAFANHLLILHAADQLPEALWTSVFTKYAATVRAMLAWYLPHVRDGLIWQPAHSDWRTAVAYEEGHHFATNLLLLDVQTRLGEHVIPPRLLRERLWAFRTPATGGMFSAVLGSGPVRLDDNLLAVLWSLKPGGMFTNRAETAEHFARVVESPFWRGFVGQVHADESRTDCFCCLDRHEAPETTGFPGFAAWPNAGDVGLCARVCGTQTVHSSAYWSWLVVLAREVQYLLTFDAGAPLPGAMFEHAARGRIEEVMRHRVDLPAFRTCLFSGSSKHSLGAAHVYVYLKTLRGASHRKNEYI